MGVLQRRPPTQAALESGSGLLTSKLRFVAKNPEAEFMNVLLHHRVDHDACGELWSQVDSDGNHEQYLHPAPTLVQ